MAEGDQDHIIITERQEPEEMTRASNIIEALMTRLDSFTSNTKKTAKERLTKSYLESKLETLGNLKLDFEKYSQTYASFTSRDERQVLPFFVQDWAATFEDKYEQIRQWIQNVLEKHQSRQGSGEAGGAPVINQIVVPTTQDTLKKVTIPIFDGSIDKWPQFRDLFTTVVHNHATLSAVQKFMHLKAYISGRAEVVIREITISDANYENAWAAMLRAFNNQRVLVDNQLKLILETVALTSEAATALKDLMYQTSNAYQSIRNQGLDIRGWDYWVVFVVVRKLPYQTKLLWEQSVAAREELPDFTLLLAFLEERCRTLESLQGNTSDSKPLRSGFRSGASSKSFRSVGQWGETGCRLCNKDHSIVKCRSFLEMSPAQRKTTTRDLKLCINCLSEGHYLRECSVIRSCTKCSDKHHDLLHVTKNPKPSDPVMSTLTSLCSKHVVGRKLFATVVVRVRTAKNGFITLRALMDSGSESSFMTTAAAQLIGGKCEKVNVPIHGLSDTLVGTSTSIKKFSFSSLYDDKTSLEVEAYVLPKVTSVSPPVSKAQRESWTHVKGLQLADPRFDEAGPVDLLLDLGVYTRILQSGLIKGEEGAPSATKTAFGWMVFGTINATHKLDSKIPVKACLTNVRLDEQMRRFWEIEKIPFPELVSAEDQKCEDLFRQEHRRRSDGSYEVPLPLKCKFEGVSQLGESAGAAKSRFLRLERAFGKDGVLHRKYIEEMQGYFDLDQIENVPKGAVDPRDRYAIPHHAVNNSKAKFRVVYDASAKTTSGKSLNDVTLTGPKLQTNLIEIVTNWRQYRICFQGDIAKMYRQIHVLKTDRDYQRIYWRSHKEDILEEYRLKRLTFGVNASPYLAIRTLHQLVQDEGKNFPLAVRPVTRETYMDDVRSGGDSKEHASQVLNETIMCLQAGGFPLRKILSNSEEFLRSVPKEWIDPCTTVDLWQKDGVVKSLGIFWDTSKDVFTYRINMPDVRTSGMTKRDLISNVAMLFDPVGWVAPVILKAKLLIQEVWKEKVDWDNLISDELSRKWREIRESLRVLEGLAIPRWVGLRSNVEYELHGFGDASQVAFATAVYIRVKYEGRYLVYLISARTKVAPLLTETIPRLELCAAVLTTELLEILENTFGRPPVAICLWSDSTITLGWLRTVPTDWNTFVSNRIAKVQGSKLNVELRHVPSEHNPADIASRGCLAEELVGNDLWWNGPHWLSQDESCWPKIPVDPPKIPTESVLNLHARPFVSYPILSRFSSWSRAKHAIAWCYRFYQNCKAPRNSRVKTCLSVSELREAESKLLKLDQSITFEDLKLDHVGDVSLRIETRSKKRKRLLKLTPFVGSDGLLRAGGRLSNSNLPFGRKYPIILAEDSQLVPLIIRSYHQLSCHGGTQLVLNLIRSRFWILGGRACVQRIVSACVNCKRVEPQLSKQLMGQLPLDRIDPQGRAFVGVGIDFAGPIQIKASRLGSRATRSGQSKNTMLPCYIAVFVCLTTKALHLEAVSELTTAAFLAAVQRFVARRGKPDVFYSDNGTNFRGADAKLKRDRAEALNKVSQESREELVNAGIEWKYITPNSPHAGGLWEAAVKSMKHLMYRTIQSNHLNFEELSTLLCQIEASLNSRPLTKLSEDPTDTEVLTPGHFLGVGGLMGLPDDPVTWEDRPLTLKSWQRVQKMSNEFWKRWSFEYLSSLQPKMKWLRKKGNLKIGDLVLIKDDDLPARKWLRGRVVELKVGSDELVRSARIQTARSAYWRDVRHLALLPAMPVQAS